MRGGISDTLVDNSRVGRPVPLSLPECCIAPTPTPPPPTPLLPPPPLSRESIRCASEQREVSSASEEEQQVAASRARDAEESGRGMRGVAA